MSKNFESASGASRARPAAGDWCCPSASRRSTGICRFGFFDDGAEKNAYATRETLIAGMNKTETKGTVLFGSRLFHDTLTEFHDNGIAVIAICAHEFAHIYQYFSPYQYHVMLTRNFPTVKLAELHADYLAGYFLAALKTSHPELDLQGAGESFERMGDIRYNAPEHHGTPVQRVAAIEAGFEFGRNGQTKWTNDIAMAAAAGAEFVVQHFS